MSDALELVLSKLDAPRVNGSGWTAKCPAHPDNNPSLSITEGDTQPVTFFCHAGCEPDAIVVALGLTWADVSALRDEPGRGEWMPGGKEAVAVYDYLDGEGKLVFQVLRSADKQFSQRRPDASKAKGWAWNLQGVERVLYRLPRLADAIAKGERIFVVEGEKDVHSIERQGEVATCNAGGAGKWKPHYSESLRGAHVVIVGDQDEPGRKHVAEVQASLAGVAASITVAEPKAGKDVSDHLGRGFSLDDLVDVEEAEEDGLPKIRVYSRKDLESIPPPRWLIEGLLEEGISVVWGPPGHGKSFLALDWACSLATGLSWLGQSVVKSPVLYVAAEGTSGIPNRIFAWEIDRRRRAEDFYLVPQMVDLMDGLWVRALIREVEAHKAGLLVVDTLASSMPGGHENDTKDMNQVVRSARTIREETGASVLIIHHSGVEGGRMRGNTALKGGVESEISVLQEEDGTVTVTSKKQRDGVTGARWNLQLKPVGESVVLSTTSSVTPQKAMAVLREEMAGGKVLSINDVAALVGGDLDLAFKLAESGEISRDDSGYVLGSYVRSAL